MLFSILSKRAATFCLGLAAGSAMVASSCCNVVLYLRQVGPGACSCGRHHCLQRPRMQTCFLRGCISLGLAKHVDCPHLRSLLLK